MTGSKSRRKGIGGEREWAAVLKKELGGDPKRLLGQSRDGGADVEHAGFRWEVKRRRSFNLYRFFEQGGADFVALRGDNRPWLVLMPADTFFKLWRRG